MKNWKCAVKGQEDEECPCLYVNTCYEWRYKRQKNDNLLGLGLAILFTLIFVAVILFAETVKF